MTSRICTNCRKREDVKRTIPTPKCRRCTEIEAARIRKSTTREIRSKRKQRKITKSTTKEIKGKRARKWKS